MQLILIYLGIWNSICHWLQYKTTLNPTLLQALVVALWLCGLEPRTSQTPRTRHFLVLSTSWHGTSGHRYQITHLATVEAILNFARWLDQSTRAVRISLGMEGGNTKANT